MAFVRGPLLLAICVIVTMTTCRAYIHSSHGCQIRQRLKAKQCLILKTFPSGNETCANPEILLPYSGISTTIDKEEWLGVEYIDRKGMATDDKQWFVRSSDIQCDGDCCMKQRKRFLFDGLKDLKLQTSTVPAPTTRQPIVTTATVSKTTMTQIITNCADNPLVSCSNSQACSSSLRSYCPLSCGLCTPPTTPPPCVDNPLVKCSDPSICSSLLKDVCPLTCGLCVPVTTAKPCLDSNLVNCSARSVCTSQFKSYCSKTCKLCGISQVLTSPSATIWIPING